MELLLIMAAFALSEPEPPVIYAGNEELERYLLEAAENHPSLLQRYEEWRAGLQRIPQAESLDDPMFSYTYFIRADQEVFGLMLSQRFPWFGRLRERGAQAAAEAEAALAQLYGARNALFARVKEAYHEYAYLARRLDVLEEQIELLEFMEESLEGLYAVGIVRQDDLFRLEIEITRLMDQYNEIVDLRPAASAQLSEALGREDHEILPWPDDTAAPPEPPPAPIVSARIRMAHPDLQALEHIRDSRRSAVALAELERYPDITVGLGFERMERERRRPAVGPALETLGAMERLATGSSMGPLGAAMDLNAVRTFRERTEPPEMRDMFMVTVSMNLPVRRQRIAGGIAEAKAEERAVQHEHRARMQALDRDARMALFRIQDAKRRYELQRDSLIPQMEETFESLERSYGSGVTNVNFIDVLDAQRTLLELELEKIGALRDWRVAVAELEELMGGPWASEAYDAMDADPFSDFEVEDLPSPVSAPSSEE